MTISPEAAIVACLLIMCSTRMLRDDGIPNKPTDLTCDTARLWSQMIASLSSNAFAAFRSGTLEAFRVPIKHRRQQVPRLPDDGYPASTATARSSSCGSQRPGQRVLPARQFEDLAKLFCPGPIRSVARTSGSSSSRLMRSSSGRPTACSVGPDLRDRVTDGNQGRIPLAGLREAFRQKCREMSDCAARSDRPAAYQWRDATTERPPRRRRSGPPVRLFRTQGRPHDGGPGNAFRYGQSNKSPIKSCATATVPNPHKHEASRR